MTIPPPRRTPAPLLPDRDPPYLSQHAKALLGGAPPEPDPFVYGADGGIGTAMPSKVAEEEEVPGDLFPCADLGEEEEYDGDYL